MCFIYIFLIYGEKNSKDIEWLNNTKFAHRGLYLEDQSIPENSLKAFDEAYEKGYFEKVITTNLNYHPEEIYDRPYYVQANMSKYIASIIDFMNHDVSTENVQIPAEKIHEILNRYNNRLPLDEE